MMRYAKVYQNNSLIAYVHIDEHDGVRFNFPWERGRWHRLFMSIVFPSCRRPFPYPEWQGGFLYGYSDEGTYHA